jgi:hypothetical protein
MKNKLHMKAFLLAGALMALGLLSARAQTIITSYTNTFDNSNNTALYQNNGWMYWYSLYQDVFSAGYNLPMTNDPTMDAEGNTNTSGSLFVYMPFAPRGQTPAGGVNPEPSYGEQSLMSGTFGGGLFDTSVQMKIGQITNIQFKIHVLPGTATDPNGNFGVIYPGLKSAGYNGDTGSYTNGLTIPGSATNGWVTLRETNAAEFINVAQNVEPGTNAQGVEFYYNQYGNTNFPNSPITFWIDDLIVQSAAAPPPPPPAPSLTLMRAVPGLNLFTGSGTSLYNRESIESTSGSYSWVGRPGPVSFSFTITNYSVGTNDQVQNHIFLVPNPGTETAPDYTEPNLVMLDLESTTSGGANWMFRYKTNQANGNAMVYGNGTLATISSPTALGTWTVTFNQNSNVTMAGPGGISTNFSIPDTTGATAALFANNVFLYYGVQAGNAGGTQDHIVASEFKVTGSTSDFDDNFVTDAGVLNPSIWMTNAQYPTSVQLVAPGNPFWIDWTSPATGFRLESTPSLSPPIIWTPATNNALFSAGTNFWQLVSTNDLASGTHSNEFFHLAQRSFTQLLVVLPGQTFAPGTSTGLKGTPTPLSLNSGGGQYDFTVLAVDSKFNLVTSISDRINITSSDTNAVLPAPAALANGSGVFEVFFTAKGSQTVTATDMTSTNIPPATSSAVSVQ